MDTKQLNCDCADCNLPAGTPPETLGQNSHDIRPEMRVNKVKDAGQTVGCPDLETMHLGIPNKTSEQPNPNQKLITEIEGLMGQVTQKIYALSYDKIHQDRTIKSQAIEEIDKFKTTLIKLRQGFE